MSAYSVMSGKLHIVVFRVSLIVQTRFTDVLAINKDRQQAPQHAVKLTCKENLFDKNFEKNDIKQKTSYPCIAVPSGFIFSLYRNVMFYTYLHRCISVQPCLSVLLLPFTPIQPCNLSLCLTQGLYRMTVTLSMQHSRIIVFSVIDNLEDLIIYVQVEKSKFDCPYPADT